MFKLEKIEQTIIDTRDKFLIKGTLNGNEKSYQTLISYYKKRIQTLGMSFFKNETETDDFVQEVFIKTYTKLSQFKGESTFSTWLTTIAYNTAINAVNRKKEYESLSENTELTLKSKTDTPEEAQIKEKTREAVNEAVKELPEKYKICIELYFYYDNSYDEISKITGENLNTIKSHILRAKKILREKLKSIYEN